MHKGGKENMGEMVIRISFFLLPSCGLSHLPTSYLHFTLAIREIKIHVYAKLQTSSERQIQVENFSE